jgi:hypothetical protein
MRETFVGVDMAKAEFVESCRPEGTGWTATNDPEGIAATVARLRTLTPALGLHVGSVCLRVGVTESD